MEVESLKGEELSVMEAAEEVSAAREVAEVSELSAPEAEEPVGSEEAYLCCHLADSAPSSAHRECQRRRR